MARFIPKQFAENSTTSVVFGSFQEQGGNVGDGTISNDPATLQGGTAWPLGWKAATDNFFQIPRGEEMDGVNRVITAAIVQQFTDGLTFWQSEMPVTQYQTIVQYQTGSDLPKLYINITGASTSTPPDSDTTNWYMFLDTGTSLANVDLSNLSATGQAVIDGKANTDASNFTTAGKETIVGWGMPDYSAGIAKPINENIIATTDAFVFVTGAASSNALQVYIDGVGWKSVGGNVYSTSCCAFGFYVKKGQLYSTKGVVTYGSWVGSVTEFPLYGVS